MRQSKVFWLVWFVAFVVLDFTIPYAVLQGVVSFSGAYLFWASITIIVIASAVVYMRSWRDAE